MLPCCGIGPLWVTIGLRFGSLAGAERMLDAAMDNSLAKKGSSIDVIHDSTCAAVNELMLGNKCESGGTRPGTSLDLGQRMLK
jgi:hypothetical protein